MVEGGSNTYPKAHIDESNIYLLGELDNYKSRSISKLAYESVSDTEIKIYGSLFTVSWDGNKVTMALNTDSTHKLVFIKESSVPTAEEWITTVNPVSKIQQATFVNTTLDPNDRVFDLAYYNGSVYTSGHRNLNGDYVLTKINPNDFSMTDVTIPNGSITTLSYEDNIEYMGSNKFWSYQRGSPNDRMYEFNTTTLEEVNSIVMPNQFGSVYQLGSNGTDLYGAFIGGIRKWNFVDQKWGNEIVFGYNNPNDGIDLDNQYLYVGKGRIIHKYDLSTFQAVGAYDISMDNTYTLQGFTLTSNNHIVASVYNTSTTKYEIVSIMLP